ncbi:MAG: hypothetical protein GEV09_15520 [Pseudonocardiaceae bacterium]|nr:hypothetical protein [Pseudonocardiaceae bacterium]
MAEVVRAEVVQAEVVQAEVVQAEGVQAEGVQAQPGAARRHDELGRRGEDLAAEFLTAQGLVVLSRNWRCRQGELDLVATDRTRLVLVSHT